ncbi:MAG: GNAT family N-acetyltransferase [bacterium]|nr:GNAT family N-acetyltransferase [bacterium]
MRVGGALRIDTLDSLNDRRREQAAAVLVEAFRHAPTAWNELESARVEVAACVGPDRIGWVAIEDDLVVGWIGAIEHSVHIWELHPLAVHPECQGTGIGTALVHRLEAEARRDGICTIWLGTDDDFGGTSLYGQDLYPDVLDQVRRLHPISRHPLQFFRKMGFVVVGVLPDASGLGRHDIIMAKRAAPSAQDA